MVSILEDASWVEMPNETLFIERILGRFYNSNFKDSKNLTFHQIVAVVQKELEASEDTSILTLKSKSNQRDPHAVKSLQKIISDTIADLGITSQSTLDPKDWQDPELEAHEEQGDKAHEEAVLFVFSQLYGFKNIAFEKMVQNAKKNRIEEIYVNRRNDVRYVVGNQKRKADSIFWDNDQDILEILQRLTLNHPDGSAGKNNPVGRLRLADGTRLTFTAGDSSKPSFNMRFDHSTFLSKSDFVPRVMSEEVYLVVLALTAVKAAYGIIGKGAIGKTALLRQMLLELLLLQPHIRLFIMELMAELNMERFLLEKKLDPDIVECAATKEKSLEALFENMKQRAADLIVQGEILSASEVSNLLTGYKAGHPMGPFTAHSDGKQLPRYLAELLAQEKHLDLEASTSQVMHVLDAAVVLKEKIDGEPRKLVEIWQYPDQPKLLVHYNRKKKKYEFYPAEGELREKLESLAFDEETRFLHRHLCQLGIIGGESPCLQSTG